MNKMGERVKLWWTVWSTVALMGALVVADRLSQLSGKIRRPKQVRLTVSCSGCDGSLSELAAALFSAQLAAGVLSFHKLQRSVHVLLPDNRGESDFSNLDLGHLCHNLNVQALFCRRAEHVVCMMDYTFDMRDPEYSEYCTDAFEDLDTLRQWVLIIVQDMLKRIPILPAPSGRPAVLPGVIENCKL